MDLCNCLFSHNFHYEGHSSCVLPIRSSSLGPSGNSVISDHQHIMKETAESQPESQQSSAAIKSTE